LIAVGAIPSVTEATKWMTKQLTPKHVRFVKKPTFQLANALVNNEDAARFSGHSNDGERK
jgi:hypothetical protein